jgi:hypothetical protein
MSIRLQAQGGAKKMKKDKGYKVKAENGYIVYSFTYHADGSIKIDYEVVQHHDFSDTFNYQDACAIAFDLNKQRQAIDYAVVEETETV